MRPLCRRRGRIEVSFGRYKGEEVGCLPHDYLEWMASTLQEGQCAIWGALAQHVLDQRAGNKTPGSSLIDTLLTWNAHEQLDAASYAFLVRQTNTAEEGRKVHKQIVKLGLDRNNTYLGNLVIHMYKRCGDLEAACGAFDGMSKRNLFSWNILMSALAMDASNRAERVYQLMPQWDVVSLNVLIAAFGRNGDLQRAVGMFEQAGARGCRDRVSWNALIAAHSRSSFARKKRAMELFLLMDLDGSYHPPDVFTLVSVFEACTSIHQGRMLHRQAVVQVEGMRKLDVAVGNSLMSMYGRFAGGLREAKEVFELGLCRGRDVVSWNALLAACMNNGEVEEAEVVLSKMACRNVVSWNTMIAGSDLQCARDIFDSMPERDLVSWNSIMAACVRGGECQEAMDLYEQMLVEEEETLKRGGDKVTLTTVLDACSGVGLESMGMRVLREHGGECEMMMDLVVGNAVIKFHARFGNLVRAEVVFERLKHHGDVVSWSTMIAAHAQSGGVVQAVKLAWTMLVQGLVPNLITSMSLLSVCSHAGAVNVARFYFVSLQTDYGISLNMDHYISMIDILARTGQVNSAHELIQYMPFHADEVAWRTLVMSGWHL